MLEGVVVGDGLDDVLAVVEHALDGDVVDVLVLQAEHLRLLEGAHAAVRAGREHTHARPLPRMAYSAALPVSPLVAPRMLSCSPRRPSSYSNRLPSNCMAMSLKASVGPLDGLRARGCFRGGAGHDLARAEHFGGVRLGAQGLQVGRGCRRCRATDLERQLGIALLVVGLAQAREHGVIHLRVMLGQVQATIGRQAFEEDVAKPLAVCMAAGAEVLHEGSRRYR